MSSMNANLRLGGRDAPRSETWRTKLFDSSGKVAVVTSGNGSNCGSSKESTSGWWWPIAAPRDLLRLDCLKALLVWWTPKVAGAGLMVCTWTAFFKLPEGGFRTVGKISSEDECKRYIGAFKDGIPTACRQLAMPSSCSVACVATVPAPPPAAKPVEPDPTPAPPDPASIAPSDIQVGGKQYTKVAGLTWVESGQSTNSSQSSAFADVSVGPTELQSKDKPSLPKTAEKKRVAPHYYDRAPQPLQAFIDTVMLPFDFLSYPGRRDW
jgi:hypothetical protein